MTTKTTDAPRVAITRLAGFMAVSPESIRRTVKGERAGAIVNDGITQIQAQRWARLRWRNEPTRQAKSLRRIETLFGSAT